MTEPNEQESALMPCPFCGESKVSRNGNEYQIWCINDSCKGAHFIDAEAWQNAWAHKQIAEKDRRIKELEFISDEWDRIHAIVGKQDDITCDNYQKLYLDLKEKNEILETHCEASQEALRESIAEQVKSFDKIAQLEVAQTKLVNREQLILQQNDKIDKLEQLASKLAGALEKIKELHAMAWDYAKRHPTNAGLGIPSILEETEIDMVLSEWRSFNEGNYDKL